LAIQSTENLYVWGEEEANERIKTLIASINVNWNRRRWQKPTTQQWLHRSGTQTRVLCKIIKRGLKLDGVFGQS